MSVKGKWINKTRLICTMEYYSAFKRNDILICATTWVSLEDIMVRETNQTRKDKCCMIPLQLIETERRLEVTRG